MAREVTLNQLVSRLENDTDIENDGHLTTAQKQDAVAVGVNELWDKMIESGLGHKLAKTVTFNTTADTLEYDLQSATYIPDQDFYKVYQVYVDEGNGQRRPIEQINLAEVQSFRPVPNVVPIILKYIPAPPTLKSGGSYDGSATVDGIAGWEEYALMVACCKVKMKKDDDYSQYERKRQQLEQRMFVMGATDNYSGPKRVVRRRSRAADPWQAWRQTANAWTLEGDKLGLLYHYGYLP